MEVDTTSPVDVDSPDAPTELAAVHHRAIAKPEGRESTTVRTNGTWRADRRR